jgi:phosphoglycolate phosphatase-like HAD superfamily hydrolase
MIFFFDLDGPILDVSEKYYRVYSDILSQNGFKVLPKSEYWNAKRDRISEGIILKRSMAEPFLEKYQYERKLLIESDPYLIYDKLQDGAIQTLEKLSKSNELVLVTLRTVSEQLHKQLGYLNLKRFFITVLSSAEETTPRWRTKYNLIKSFLDKQMSREGILIGDTETDILAGRNLELKTIAVLNGIRSYKILKEANPHYIINSIKEILKIDIQHLCHENFLDKKIMGM